MESWQSWSIASALKADVPERTPWVRILHFPHFFPKMKIFSKKSEKYLAMSKLFHIFAIIITKGAC